VTEPTSEGRRVQPLWNPARGDRWAKVASWWTTVLLGRDRRDRPNRERLRRTKDGERSRGA
jgi:hypothetical protein